MYSLIETTLFKKDLKKLLRRNKRELVLTFQVLEVLKKKGIPLKMKPHQLKGNYKDNWECHIKPDLLIIWFQIEDPKTIKLIRIGAHSDLFK